MKQLIKDFISNLHCCTLDQLENYSLDWLNAGKHKWKDSIYPFILQEKLLRYESEY